MNDSKLIEILELLSKKEWNSLKNFVFSPMCFATLFWRAVFRFSRRLSCLCSTRSS